MRLTLTVELSEHEQSRLPHIKRVMEELNPNVDTRFVLDKNALAERILEAINTKNYDTVLAEVKERLLHPAYMHDCVETICSVVFFSPSRVVETQSRSPFIFMVSQLPEENRELVKNEILRHGMTILSAPRRLDCSRVPLISCAETLILMVKTDILPIRNIVMTLTEMIRLESTRTAGMTCLGKVVEQLLDAIRTCDPEVISSLCRSLVDAYHGDTFLYDVKYVMDAFGWTASRSPLSLLRNCAHHRSPILTMAYSGGVNAREFVVSASADGSIATWDGNGILLENTILSRHYASSVHLMNRGNALLVGTVGCNANTPPAVILYQKDVVSSEWVESHAVEPAGAQYITGVRGFHSNPDYRFCVCAHMLDGRNSLFFYDYHQEIVREFRDHRDIITCVHVPAENDHSVLTASRDAMVCLYDLRTPILTSTFAKHKNTVTAIATVGDLLVTGGLDKMLILQDLRMNGVVATYELDSAILGLAVTPAMQCAVSTLTGVNMSTTSIAAPSGGISSFARVDCGPFAPRYNALSWNANGTLLYAGGDSCTLDLYHRSEAMEY